MTFVHDTLTDGSVQARFLVNSGAVRFSFRQSEAGSYTVTLTDDGIVMLTRNTDLLGMARSPVAPNDWHTLRLSALGGDVRVAIDGAEVIAYQDNTLLPPGTISIAPANATSIVLVDDFELWIAINESRLPLGVVATIPISASADARSSADSVEILPQPGQSMVTMNVMTGGVIIPAGDVAALRQAIESVNGDYTTIPHEIVLTTGTYHIDVGLTIVGTSIVIYGNDSILEADAGLQNPIITVGSYQTHSATNVDIHNASFTGANAPNYGGGLLINIGGSVQVFDSAFLQNTKFNGGGGLRSGGTLAVYRSVFDGNFGGSGAAIHNSGILTVTCSTFRNNTFNWGGAIHQTAGDGP